jgi:hypothetical protein
MFGKRIALGIATAALAVSSLAAPSIASANVSIPIHPDVKVTYDNHYRFMNSTIFHFDVKNIGTAEAGTVTYIGQCSYLEADATYRNVNQFLGAQAHFVRGETRQMTVQCEKDGPHAAKATLHAIVPDDMDTSNNRGRSPDMMKP